MIEVACRTGAITGPECLIAKGQQVALYAGLALLAAGFAWYRMWTVLPWERLGLCVVLAGMSFALALPLRRFARWHWASALALVWVLALVGFAGLLQILGALALAAAALALGGLLVPADTPARLAMGTTLGLALIAGVGGWVLTLPIHFIWSWWGLVAGLLLWRRRALHAMVGKTVLDWREAVGQSPSWAAFAVTCLGLASTAAWVPTMQVDDLAYHLALPSQLLAYGEYRPDPAHQIWSYAPWAGDALQGFAAILAAGHARGGVNALWLVLAAAAIWSACSRMGARPAERWGAVALFASMPPLVWMAAGMQTELPATAVLATLAALIVGPTRTPATGGRLFSGAILFGALFGIKGVHVLSGLPLVAYAAWRHRRALPWRQLPLALGLTLLVGGASYAQSWWHTGNPVLPLFNAFFQSPYFPAEANYRDARWFAGFSPALPWQMVFNTDRYVEAWDGAIGFSLVALSGAWLLAVMRRETRGLALTLSLAALLPLVPMQYARYAYPGLLLLVLAQVPFGQSRFGERAFGRVLILACMFNLAFQANASWLHHSSALKRVIRSGGETAAVYPHYVPERLLLLEIPADDTGLVLATNPSRAYIAELAGRGRSMLDHDPTLQAARKQAESDPSGAGWALLLDRHGIRWVLVTPATASTALQAALRQKATRVSALGDAELWRVRDEMAAQ